ncbi:unnamed protein product, partial [Urochloa decumbens]
MAWHTLLYCFPLFHAQLFLELIWVNCLEGFSNAHRSGKGYSYEDTCITACFFYLICKMFRSIKSKIEVHLHFLYCSFSLNSSHIN